MKEIYLDKNQVDRYIQATHYRRTNWPTAFLLTFWQEFNVAELNGRTYYLVAQTISLKGQLLLNQSAWCQLERLEIIPKTTGELWHYRLTVRQESGVAYCDTTLYVRCRK